MFKMVLENLSKSDVLQLNIYKEAIEWSQACKLLGYQDSNAAELYQHFVEFSKRSKLDKVLHQKTDIQRPIKEN